MSLGVWQMERLQWKNNLIQKIEQNKNENPMDINEIIQKKKLGEKIEYHPVIITGTFQHQLEQHYWATQDNKVGYFIYTPMIMENKKIVFVNRGYVPTENKNSDTRQKGQVQGIVKVKGLIQNPQRKKANRFVPDNDMEKNIFYWKSLEDMAQNAFGEEEIDLLNFFVDADNTPNDGGWPVGGMTRVEFPNSHLLYAITWFALAVALFIMAFTSVYRLLKILEE